MPLPTLKNYISVNRHLPGVPAASTIQSSGIDAGETSALLLRKTEELTLYLLQLDERLKAIESTKDRRKGDK